MSAAAAAPCWAWAQASPRSYTDSALAFSIELPEGYLGPIEHAGGPSVSRGFRKPYPGTALNTVILVSVQSMGPSFAQRLAAERAALTRETLRPVIAGIERNRGGFRAGEARNVTISGYAGLKQRWQGSAQGVAFEGVVYCVLAATRAYAVQIQDPSGRGRARLDEAIRAVERMRIGR
ncbi:MAG: hypothetical protein IT531_21625 [Burkholderiales bacterium]|nr:hypothetical protein [Burkholderiales bacterium]